MPPIVSTVLWIAFAVLVLFATVQIVPQAKAYVVERLGAYRATWSVGIHFKIPVIDRVAKKVSLKEQVVDFPPQPVITKDNVTMQIDTIVYFQIIDPKLYTYGVEVPMAAIENLTATTLRNIIGDLELDETLTSRDHINGRMRIILDEATDAWGIRVNRVELKNILPPREIQDAMEKQMKAERERRQAILQAEGEKQSQILVAEGEKQSAILRADASKITKIREAEGEAEAILTVQKRWPTPSPCSTPPRPARPSSSSRRWRPLRKRPTGRRPSSSFPARFRRWQVWWPPRPSVPSNDSGAVAGGPAPDA